MKRFDRTTRSGTRGTSRGFTLLELLVVLAIIALLVGLVAPKVIQYLGRAKTETARTQLHNVMAALDLYRLDAGRYPTQAEGVDALMTAPGGSTTWTGPYLQNAKGLSDPWGEKFVYRIPGQHSEYDLYSLGSDKSEGGEGEDQDVTSW
jgi:general secretion pathway protein G